MATSMLRRDFILACGPSTLTASLPATPAGASARFYSRALLVDPAGRPLEAGALPENRNFIFHYPFAGTPCFLLNLGKATKPSAQLKTADEQRSEEHTSELQSLTNLVCRLLLEKKTQIYLPPEHQSRQTCSILL